MCIDFFNNEINIGSTVAFPNGRNMMLGVVEKIRPRKMPLAKTIYHEIFVVNESGYKKWKNSTDTIRKEQK